MNFGLTVLFISVFIISLGTALYILYLESRKGKTQNEKDISQEKIPTEAKVESNVSTTDKEDDSKPMETEQHIEAANTVTEIKKKDVSTSQRESIFRIFEVVHPGNVLRKFKRGNVKTIEKPDVIGTGDSSAPLKSANAYEGIDIVPSIQPDMDESIPQEEPPPEEPSLEEPVPDSFYIDTIPISSDQQLPSETPEPIINVVPSIQPDINESISPEEPSMEEPASGIYYIDTVPISDFQPLPSEIEAQFTEVEILPSEAESFHYEPPIIFAITNLLVRPLEIHPGDTMFISFVVTNHGMIADYCTITLKIGGFTIHTDQIYLSPMESKYINFPIRAVQPGSWDIDINGVAGKLIILG